MRVPFIVRWPARVKPGVRMEMLCITDLFATAASVTGRKIPARAAVDSIDQLPVMLGDADQPKRTSVVLEGVSQAIAFREGEWKLHLATGSKAATNIGSGADAKDMLFNLAEDPRASPSASRR